jgi:hypothetical protein
VSSQSSAQGATEQAAGLEEMSSSLEETASMTTQNADNTEESASASEELSAQAESMSDIVGQLATVVGGSGMGANKAQRGAPKPKTAHHWVSRRLRFDRLGETLRQIAGHTGAEEGLRSAAVAVAEHEISRNDSREGLGQFNT